MRPACLAAAFVFALPAAVSTAAPPTFEQSLSLMSVRAPRISPDGRTVVYERQETDWKENAYVTQLFLADVASGRPMDRVPDRARRSGRAARSGGEGQGRSGGQARCAADLGHRSRRR